jgi:single-strand DNA-binding protein
MAEGLNRWTGLGNLGADPELRITGGGQAVLKMRLAISENYKGKDDKWTERTEWVSVVVWGRRGEALSKFLKKGDRIYVEGAMRTSSYEKSGEKRYRTEIVASNVLFANSRGETERTAERGAGSGSSAGSSSSQGGDRPPGRAGGGRDGGAAAPAPQDDFGDYGGSGDNDIPFVVDAARLGWWRP